MANLDKTSDTGAHGAHHVADIKVYLGVFAALLVLTVVTVGVSLLHLPQPFGIIVAIAVAMVKATLVAAFFMHLKGDDRFYTFIFVTTLFFIGLFFALTMLDMDFRAALNPEEGTGVYQKYEQKEFAPNAPMKPGSSPAKSAEGEGEHK